MPGITDFLSENPSESVITIVVAVGTGKLEDNKFHSKKEKKLFF